MAVAVAFLKSNPASDWQEETQIPGLTLYDLYSDARRVLQPYDENGDDIMVEVPRVDIEKELRCNSCLEIFENTQLNTICLHRNCKKCVLELCKMKDGNNAANCPQCRRKIQSKRNFNNDKNFDELISDIYPESVRCTFLHMNSYSDIFSSNVTP